MDMLCIAAEADPIGTLVVNGEPLSPADIARMTGGALDEVATLINELDRNGVLSRDRNGTIYNRRMVREAKKAKIARINGSKGGNPTLRKHKEIPASDNHQDNTGVKGRDKPHIPEARVQKEKETSLRSVKKSGSRLPEDWRPSETDAAYARSQGVPEAEIWREGERFRDFWLGKPGQGGVKLDWSATWRNWIRSTCDRKGWKPSELPLNGASPHPTPPKDERDAEGRLNVGRERQMWPRPRWGPAPGEAGCTIPPHLIKPSDHGWGEWSTD